MTVLSLFELIILFFFIIRCYSLDQNEMDSFLELVLKCVETEGSTAAVTKLSR